MRRGEAQVSGSLNKNVGGPMLAIFQAMSFIAPGAVVVSFIPEEASFVDYSVPLIFIIGAIGVLAAIYMTYAFSTRMTHAGAFYGYVDAGLGRRFATVAGWLYLADDFGGIVSFPGLLFAAVYWPLVPGLSGLSWGWLPLAFVPIVITFVIEYFGIKPSLYYTFIGGILEVSVIIGISIAMIIAVGGGNSFLPFTMAPHYSGGLGLGILYAILGFVGISSVATLSEELRAPKKTVGRSLIYAFIISFATYFLISYALVVGWGVGNTAAVASQSDSVFTVISSFLGSKVGLLLELVVVNSYISYTIANGNAVLRLGYAMARDNIIFKERFKQVHTKSGTPRRLLYLIFGLMMVVTIAVGFAFGPLYGALIILTEGAMSRYTTHLFGNFALPFFGRKLKLAWKKLWPLVFLPIPATVIYLYAIYGSIFPYPGYPYNLSDYLYVALIVIGIILAFVFVKSGKSKTKQVQEVSGVKGR